MFETLVAEITRELASNESLDNAIDDSLRRMGDYSNASRAYVFQSNQDGTLISNTHEWCAEGVSPHLSQLQDLDVAAFEWSLSQLKNGKTLSIPDVKQLAEKASNEYRAFVDQGIKSLIMVPTHMHDGCIGFMGFDNVKAAQPWNRSAQNLLEIMAEQIGSALQRKRDKDALQSYAQQLDSIMRSAEHFAFYRLAMDMHEKHLAQVEFVSDSLSGIIGVEPDAEFDRWFSRVHPDDLPELKRRNAAAAQQGTTLDMVIRMFHPGKHQWRWIRAVSNPVWSESGQITHFNGFLLDVSDMVEASQALQTEKDFADAIMDTVGALVVVLDKTGKVVSFNRACELATGYSANEIVGSYIWDKLFLAENVDNVRRVFKLLKSGRGQSSRAFENHWLTKSGKKILISWTNTSIRDAQGNLLYGIGSGMDITELRRANQELEQLASYDPLTTLPNRRLFRERLQHALSLVDRHATSLALLYIDLDDFKRINDSLGHDIGDKLLIQISRRLLRSIREEDTVARVGGDEFVVLLESISNDFDISMVASKILRQIKRPIQIEEHELVISGSIGITTAPQDSMDAGKLLRNADLAMYRSKSRGRNTYEYFENKMNADASERLILEVELRQAMKKNLLKPHFQPIVRLSDLQIVGFEALARWHHPTRGYIPPDRFIPIAEDCGLIVPIGKSLLLQTATEIMQLREKHQRDLYVAFNLSASQVQDSRLVDMIMEVLQETGLPSHALRFEITESLLLKDFIITRNLITQLQQRLGTHFSIDDFGTGYSSLSYLKQLPIHTIKIDREFVKDIPADQDDIEITSAIIAVAQALHKSVIAEGVENKQQLKYLLEKNCLYAQGYLFGRPDEPAAFMDQSMSLDID
jgi:diguanylate cyclase (GGDEF)-like protein/PAS domain S-box-containing protein